MKTIKKRKNRKAMLLVALVCALATGTGTTWLKQVPKLLPDDHLPDLGLATAEINGINPGAAMGDGVDKGIDFFAMGPDNNRLIFAIGDTDHSFGNRGFSNPQDSSLNHNANEDTGGDTTPSGQQDVPGLSLLGQNFVPGGFGSPRLPDQAPFSEGEQQIQKTAPEDRFVEDPLESAPLLLLGPELPKLFVERDPNCGLVCDTQTQPTNNERQAVPEPATLTLLGLSLLGLGALRRKGKAV